MRREARRGEELGLEVETGVLGPFVHGRNSNGISLIRSKVETEDFLTSVCVRTIKSTIVLVILYKFIYNGHISSSNLGIASVKMVP